MPLLRRFARSYRRRLLDADLAFASGALVPPVLEVGAGRTGRRGTFQPPPAALSRWTYVDRTRAVRPHAQADVLALPFASETFKTIVCLEVFEYVSDLQRCFSELARVLRMGGRLIVSVPFVHHWDAEQDAWRVSPVALVALASRAGFRVVEMRSQGGALASAANILLFASWNCSASVLVRTAVTAAAFIPLEMLFHLDRYSLRWSAKLARYSTGYLAVFELPLAGDDG